MLNIIKIRYGGIIKMPLFYLKTSLCMGWYGKLLKGLLYFSFFVILLI